MRRSGFTLIELLVVIAIMGLLLAILVPSLAAIKEYASVTNCLTNQKSLATAFIMYASDNQDRFCSGFVFPDAQTRNPPSWVKAPLQYDASGGQVFVGNGDAGGLLLNLDARINGIREGALYPYLENTGIFHCPGDKRIVRGASGNWAAGTPPRYYQMYRSYGMPDFYAVHDSVDNVRNKVKSLADIKGGGQKMLFVEDQYDRRYYNIDGWSYIPYDQSLWDPLGNYHNKSATFSFVDGHAALYKWRDSRTMIFMSDRDQAEALGFGRHVKMPGNVDLNWLDAQYPSKTQY